jgi:hypothetical protein
MVLGIPFAMQNMFGEDFHVKAAILGEVCPKGLRHDFVANVAGAEACADLEKPGA